MDEHSTTSAIEFKRFSRVMKSKEIQKLGKSELPRYSIRIKGHISNHWGDWFGNASICCEQNGVSTIVLAVSDQAALFGMLRKIRDAGMVLLSVNLINEEINRNRRKT